MSCKICDKNLIVGETYSVDSYGSGIVNLTCYACGANNNFNATLAVYLGVLNENGYTEHMFELFYSLVCISGCQIKEFRCPCGDGFTNEIFKSVNIEESKLRDEY